MRSDQAVRELHAADRLLAVGDLDASAAARERAHEMLHGLRATTAVFDADAALWHFGHETAGPAGAATVRLGAGCALTVDVADPQRLLGLTAPVAHDASDAAAVRGVVRHLVGAGAAACLAADGEAGGMAIVPFAAETAATLRALGRLAVLDRLREIDEREHGAWPLWGAEAAVLCARASAVPGCDRRARAEAASCGATVLAAAKADLSAAARERLAELVPELRPLADSPVEAERFDRALGALQTLGDDRPAPWNERLRELFASVASAVTPQMPRIAWSSPRGVARLPHRPRASATFPIPARFVAFGLDDQRAQVIWEPGAVELEIYCHTVSGGGADRLAELWARAFTPPPDLTFLDGAPFALASDEPPDEDGRPFAIARLSLPPGLSADLLRFDLTDEPAEPPAESRLGLCRRARECGEAAAAAERAGLHLDAARLWESSAERWARGGAELQRTIAEIFRAQSLDELAGEEESAALRAAIRSRAPVSAWRIARDRERMTPFIGELTRREDVGPTDAA